MKAIGLIAGLMMSPIALGFTSNVMPKEFKDLVAKSKNPNGVCVDFTGIWTGECEETTISGGQTSTQTVPGTIKIQQAGCDLWDGEGAIYHFGGSRTETQTTSAFTNSATTVTDWNSDQSEAKFSTTFTGRTLGSPVVSIFYGNGSNTYRIQNGKLKTRGRFKSTTDLSIADPIVIRQTIKCTYEKETL